MSFLTQPDRELLERISGIVSCNPFVPERIERERELLGADYVDEGPFRSFWVDACEMVGSCLGATPLCQKGASGSKRMSCS